MLRMRGRGLVDGHVCGGDRLSPRPASAWAEVGRGTLTSALLRDLVPSHVQGGSCGSMVCYGWCKDSLMTGVIKLTPNGGKAPRSGLTGLRGLSAVFSRVLSFGASAGAKRHGPALQAFVGFPQFFPGVSFGASAGGKRHGSALRAFVGFPLFFLGCSALVQVLWESATVRPYRPSWAFRGFKR